MRRPLSRWDTSAGVTTRTTVNLAADLSTAWRMSAVPGGRSTTRRSGLRHRVSVSSRVSSSSAIPETDGKTLGAAEQEPSGGDLDSVHRDRLHGRTGAAESRHLDPACRGIATESKHARHIGAIEVGVDQSDVQSGPGEAAGEADGDAGLADPTFAASNGYDRHLCCAHSPTLPTVRCGLPRGRSRAIRSPTEEIGVNDPSEVR